MQIEISHHLLKDPNEEINYHNLSLQMIVLLRGDISQNQLSQNLGYTFNQVGKWESGVTAFSWSDFIDLCEFKKINWQESFNSTFSFNSGMFVSRNNVFDILSQFWDKKDSSALIKLLGKSVSTISRLRVDSQNLALSDVLKLANLRPFVLSVWLGKMFDPSLLLEIKEKHAKEQMVLSGLVTLPWTPLVNACFWLTPYQELESHSDEWIAKKVGLTIDQVQKSIQVLHAHDILYISDGKFRSSIKDFTFLRREEFRKVTQFVLQKMTESFKTSAPVKPNLMKPSLSSQKIYPVSIEASKKISDILVEFHHKINEVLQQDHGQLEHVRLINIQSVDLEVCPAVSDSEASRS